MDRRSFIRNSSLSLVAVTLLGKGSYALAPGFQPTSNCLPTTSDILGPFYRPNAPFRTDLTVTGQTGNPLKYQGQVMGPDCNPISGAIVDVWQANSAGAYDNNSFAYNYRGRHLTGSDGSYEFTSVDPGWYLNGSQYRPRHIHFRVTAPGFTELITQLYFENDPYISADPWASVPAAQLRIVPIDNTGSIPTAQFQIYLHSTQTGMEDMNQQVPVKVLQNPFESHLALSSPTEELQNFELFSSIGTLVARQYDINHANLQLQLGSLTRGVYFVRVQTSKNIYVLQVLKD